MMTSLTVAPAGGVRSRRTREKSLFRGISLVKLWSPGFTSSAHPASGMPAVAKDEMAGAGMVCRLRASSLDG